MLITAFVLSLLLLIGGAVFMGVCSHWDGIAVWVLLTCPGALGLILAIISLGVKFVPVLEVASPYLAWASCIASLSMITYMIGCHVLSLVTGE